jgi:hypothetical protein
MAVRGYRVRTSPAALFWAGGLVVLTLLSLGLVHKESGRDARERLAATPQRPLLLIDLAGNREARQGQPLAELEIWRAAAAELGRPVEVFEGASLTELVPRDFSVWILPSQSRLSEADWTALDAFLASDGGLLLTGATGTHAEDGIEYERSLAERFFPGDVIAPQRPPSDRLRVVGRSPLVAGFEPGAEIDFVRSGRALATGTSGALDWTGDEGGAAGLHGRYRGAPVAWLGFSVARLTDPDVARRIASNALRYAAREPLLELRPWPEGRPCAVLIDGDGVAQTDGASFATTEFGDRVLPEVVGDGAGATVTIPEPRPRSDAQGAALLRELLDGYELAERMGSVFSLRSERTWRAAAGRDALFASVGRELALRGAWFARPEELAVWWLAREQIDAQLEPLAPDTARVTFRNRGENTARGVTARIYVPAGANVPELLSRPWLSRRPLLRLATDHAWVEVVARPLDPGAEVSYILRF